MKRRFPVLFILGTVSIDFCLLGFASSSAEIRDSDGSEENYQIGRIYPMKYQPEYEDFAMARYFRTRELVKFQVRCFFYGGPCDIVGRWAKPRIKTGFLGACIKCTSKQKNWLTDALNLIAETDPELFRAVIGRYIEYFGVKLPLEERIRVALAFES